ncbi:MAG: hypothetical protein WBB25_17680 [Sulfitobacter sp.]
MNTLNARLLAAHAAGDLPQLVGLYREAADTANDPQAEGFYLTHAHVFAMELGHPDTAELRQRLIDQGREAPLPPPNPPLR